MTNKNIPVVSAENTRLAASAWFVLASFLLLFITHALAYLIHEYAHSIAAWSFGWMATPFGIDYGSLSLSNVVFLGDVDDNVNYAPIIAAGHGFQAAFIALAGPFLGNGLVYFIAYRVALTRFVKARRGWLMFVYWFALMCSANVWSYVPIRALTTHADIAIAAKGIGVSVWVLFPFLLVPALYLVYHFFCRMFRIAFSTIAGSDPAHLAMLIAVTGFWYFGFFGGDGMSNSYGAIAEVMSIVSRYLLFPLSVVFLSKRILSGATLR